MISPKSDGPTQTGQPFETNDFWLALLSILVVVIAFGGTLVIDQANNRCTAQPSVDQNRKTK